MAQFLFYKMANCVFSWPAHFKNGIHYFKSFGHLKSPIHQPSITGLLHPMRRQTPHFNFRVLKHTQSLLSTKDNTKQRAGRAGGPCFQFENRNLQRDGEMITIRFAGSISGRIVSLQSDKDVQKLLSNGNRIRIQLSETLLSIFRGFRLLEKVTQSTIIHLLSSEASLQPSAP